MGKYAIRRSLQALPLLFGVALLSFVLIQFLPGGPLTLLAHSPHMTAAQLHNIAHNLGLDQPGYVQFFKWVGGMARGDWGISYNDNRPVLTDIGDRLPATLLLMGAGFLVSILLAIPLGVLSAVRPYSIFDYITSFLSFFGLSMPVFWFGLMLQLIFAYHLGILPAADAYDERIGPTFWGGLRHLILPALTLGITSIAGWSRYMRSSLIEVIRQDYVRTARAKGVHRARVVWKHAVRNALIPLVTVMALDVPTYFTGAVVVEVIYSWPGMGRLFFDSLSNRDYPVQLGLLVISALLIILGNLIADLIYGYLDPRIKYT